MEQCWYNRFSTTEKRCPNEARWKTNPMGIVMSPAPLAARLVRWCDEHKQSDDVLMTVEQNDVQTQY